MRHQLCSRTVDSEKSFLSLGFDCAGLSRASQNFCQFFELISNDRASAISCSARTHALSNMKLVMFTPRCSAPRRMSLASLSLARTLNRSERFVRFAVAGTAVSLCTYARLLVYVQCTLILRARQAAHPSENEHALTSRGTSTCGAWPSSPALPKTRVQWQVAPTRESTRDFRAAPPQRGQDIGGRPPARHTIFALCRKRPSPSGELRGLAQPFAITCIDWTLAGQNAWTGGPPLRFLQRWGIKNPNPAVG